MTSSRIIFPELHNREWLRQKYVLELLTDEEIAQIVGCVVGSIRNARVKHGIVSIPKTLREALRTRTEEKNGT